MTGCRYLGMTPRWSAVAGAVLLLTTTAFGGATERRPVPVAVAESLKPALVALESAFEDAHPDQDLILRFGPSGTLRDEILKRTPTILFLCAGDAEVAALVIAGRVRAGTTVTVATNRLVLVTGIRGRLRGLTDLKDPRIRSVGIGNPSTVPLGRFGMGALSKAGVWADVRPKVRYFPSSTALVGAVERSEVDAAIVYVTDALVNPKVRVVMGLDSFAAPTPYVAAPILDDGGADPPDDLLRFLGTETARRILAERKYGTP